ncbi:uncharacterized protein [Apostichopus japonicus]|uniref:uncharacterized protein isoform X2 n=1 Tax=Stichopus japonicus TaxID=307972 RepID=UPI003AB2FCEA
MMDNEAKLENVPLINGVHPDNVHTIRGLTVVTASLFIIGEMAGSGVLALPKAVLDSGWIGIVMILVCAVMSAYTGFILGRCWTILQDRFPIYKQQTRFPYPAIGYETYGNKGRYLVSFCVNATLFGVGTVFLLIASENIQELLTTLHKDFSFCALLPIIAVCLWPITWLGTPKDFWPVAIGAMCATATACLAMFIQILLDRNASETPTYPPSGFSDFFLAFGVILFAFGGHAAFPTIQHDMRNPKDFSKVVTVAYAGIVCMYLPVSTAGYFVYGDKNEDNILGVLSASWLTTTATCLITVHLIMGFIIVINPLSQEVEDFLGIDKAFNWKRVINRTVIMGLILFVAETIPQFGAILSLVGGSTVTLLTFVFPSLFYLKLCSTSCPNQTYSRIPLPLYQWIIHYEIIFVGIVGGISSSYSAINAIATGDAQFTVPCYVNATAAHG